MLYFNIPKFYELILGLYRRCGKRCESIKGLKAGPNQKVPRTDTNCTKGSARKRIRGNSTIYI